MLGPKDCRHQVCKKAYLQAYGCNEKSFYYVVHKLKKVKVVPKSKLLKPVLGIKYATTESFLKARSIFLTENEKALGMVKDNHKILAAKVWLTDWINLVACSVPNGKKLEEMQINTMYKNEIYKVSLNIIEIITLCMSLNKFLLCCPVAILGIC